MKKACRKRDLRVTCALVTSTVILALQDTMRTLYDGVVPPLLGYARLQELNDRLYDYEGSVYLTEANTKSGLYAWEGGALDGYLCEGKRFMVLAAGGGREVMALLTYGIHVDAWECNKALREFGNRLLEKESLNCRIEAVLPSKFPAVSDGTRYDFCIVGFSAYCHMLRQEDRVALLTEMKKVLDGPVLLSFPGRKHAGKWKRALRRIGSLFPGSTKDISHDLSIMPGDCVGVGFDEQTLAEEAAAAGFKIKKFRNHSPEYPWALLVPMDD